MSRYDALNQVAVAQVVTANAVAANGTISIVPGDSHNEATAFFVASAVGGTTPTVTPTLETSPDGTNWFTLAAGTPLTVNGSGRIAASDNIGRFLRLNFLAVGGTTPTFTFAAWIQTKRKGA